MDHSFVLSNKPSSVVLCKMKYNRNLSIKGKLRLCVYGTLSIVNLGHIMSEMQKYL